MDKQLVTGGIVGAVLVTAVGAVAGYRMLDRSPSTAGTAQSIQMAQATSGTQDKCRTVVVTRTRPTKDPDQIAGTVTGAVIGGLLGNQVGDGKGKKLATVGGAVAGGYTGNKVQEGMQERNTYQETQETC